MASFIIAPINLGQRHLFWKNHRLSLV